MAWSLQGEWIETCSCDMVCPCLWGPQEKASRGWCSAAIGLNIRQGNADGVDLSNVRAVFAGDFPGNFALGEGVARLYLDEGMSEQQRQALEPILMGKMGGVWEALMTGAISRTLPTKVARVALDSGANPSVSVNGAGEIKLQRMKDGEGKQTQVVNSPVGSGFGIPIEDLAFTEGRWSDPDMRTWDAGGNGGVSSFNWSV